LPWQANTGAIKTTKDPKGFAFARALVGGTQL